MNTWQTARKEVARASSDHHQISIGSSAALWECLLSALANQVISINLTRVSQFEARIAYLEALVKQLNARQLDLLITTEIPKMKEFKNHVVGQFTPALYAAEPFRIRSELNYLHLEWELCSHRRKLEPIDGDDTHQPILTTSSAEIAYQQLSHMEGCTWLPRCWANRKPGLCIHRNELSYRGTLCACSLFGLGIAIRRRRYVICYNWPCKLKEGFQGERIQKQNIGILF